MTNCQNVLLDMVDITYTKLVQDLQSSNQQVREKARFDLVCLGMTAVPTLMKAVSSDSPNLRWQAGKVLSLIKEPAIIPSLISILVENHFFGVRWFVSEALVELGAITLEPLLTSLVEHFDSPYLRGSAQHILHCLYDEHIQPEAIEIVLHALEDVEPEAEVPWAAKKALELLKKKHP